MRRFGTYDAGDEQVVLNAGNGSNPASAPGQFVTGTFTAVSNVQYLYLDDPLGELGWGSQYNAITVYQTTGIPPKVTSVGFSGGAFQVTVENLTVGETYRLRRSTTLQDFETIGAPFTPASSTQVLQDSAPPVGKAFYIVEEVP